MISVLRGWAEDSNNLIIEYYFSYCTTKHDKSLLVFQMLLALHFTPLLCQYSTESILVIEQVLTIKRSHLIPM